MIINIAIEGSFVFFFVYFAIALIATIHDRLNQRFLSSCDALDCLCIEDFDPRAAVPTDDVLIHALTRSESKVFNQVFGDDNISDSADDWGLECGEDMEEVIAVPTKKADLIKFIQEHNLKSAIYKITGATYSNAKVNNLATLRAAVLTAIA